MNQTDKDFFKPKGRRIAATVFCALWSAIEWYHNQPFWGVITAGLAVYCYWHFFLNFDETKK